MTDVKGKPIFVVFATPSLSAHVCIDYHLAMLNTEAHLNNLGITGRAHLIRPGDAYLSKVRSKMASDFLRDYPEATHLFFIDDDVSWQPEKVAEFLMRPENVIAGIYPKKSDNLDFPFTLGVDKETGKSIYSDDGKLIYSQMVPTGFLCIQRHVIEYIAERSTFFYDNEADGTRVKFFNIFKMGPQFHLESLVRAAVAEAKAKGVPASDLIATMEGILAQSLDWWGEDFGLCQDLLFYGCDIWVDPNITMTHRGTKKWTSRLADHLPAFELNARASIEATAASVAQDVAPLAPPAPSVTRQARRAVARKRNGTAPHAGARA